MTTTLTSWSYSTLSASLLGKLLFSFDSLYFRLCKASTWFQPGPACFSRTGSIIDTYSHLEPLWQPHRSLKFRHLQLFGQAQVSPGTSGAQPWRSLRLLSAQTGISRGTCPLDGTRFGHRLTWRSIFAECWPVLLSGTSFSRRLFRKPRPSVRRRFTSGDSALRWALLSRLGEGS